MVFAPLILEDDPNKLFYYYLFTFILICLKKRTLLTIFNTKITFYIIMVCIIWKNESLNNEISRILAFLNRILTFFEIYKYLM